MSASSSRKLHRSSARAQRLILPLYVRWQKGSLSFRIAIATALAAAFYVISLLSSTLLRSYAGRITIVAAPVPVETNDPYACRAAATQTHDVNSVYKPTNPRIVQGFPATPLIGDGFPCR